MKAQFDNEGVRVAKVPECYLCGRQGNLLYRGLRDQIFGAPGTWSIAYCPRCQLAWLNPRPIPEDIGKLYANYYTHADLGTAAAEQSTSRQRIKNAILAAGFGYDALIAGKSKDLHLGRALSRVRLFYDLAGASVMWLPSSRKGRLLDVGCGNGAFLGRMRELGWQVVGVEPDPVAGRVAQQRGLEVYMGTLEDTGLAEESFDAITLNHVIEHLHNPIETLKVCQRLLRRGGWVVVVTPNVQSLGRRYFGQAWRGWHCPHHLYLFSLSSLSSCARQAGFSNPRVWTTFHPAAWYFVNSKAPGIIEADGATKARAIAYSVLEGGFSLFGNFGEEVVMIAIKDR